MILTHISTLLKRVLNTCVVFLKNLSSAAIGFVSYAFGQLLSGLRKYFQALNTMPTIVLVALQSILFFPSLFLYGFYPILSQFIPAHFLFSALMGSFITAGIFAASILCHQVCKLFGLYNTNNNSPLGKALITQRLKNLKNRVWPFKPSFNSSTLHPLSLLPNEIQKCPTTSKTSSHSNKELALQLLQTIAEADPYTTQSILHKGGSSLVKSIFNSNLINRYFHLVPLIVSLHCHYTKQYNSELKKRWYATLKCILIHCYNAQPQAKDFENILPCFIQLDDVNIFKFILDISPTQSTHSDFIVTLKSKTGTISLHSKNIFSYAIDMSAHQIVKYLLNCGISPNKKESLATTIYKQQTISLNSTLKDKHQAQKTSMLVIELIKICQAIKINPNVILHSININPATDLNCIQLNAKTRQLTQEKIKQLKTIKNIETKFIDQYCEKGISKIEALRIKHKNILRAKKIKSHSEQALHMWCATLYSFLSSTHPDKPKNITHYFPATPLANVLTNIFRLNTRTPPIPVSNQPKTKEVLVSLVKSGANLNTILIPKGNNPFYSHPLIKPKTILEFIRDASKQATLNLFKPDVFSNFHFSPNEFKLLENSLLQAQATHNDFIACAQNFINLLTRKSKINPLNFDFQNHKNPIHQALEKIIKFKNTHDISGSTRIVLDLCHKQKNTLAYQLYLNFLHSKGFLNSYSAPLYFDFLAKELSKCHFNSSHQANKATVIWIVKTLEDINKQFSLNSERKAKLESLLEPISKLLQNNQKTKLKPSNKQAILVSIKNPKNIATALINLSGKRFAKKFSNKPLKISSTSNQKSKPVKKEASPTITIKGEQLQKALLEGNIHFFKNNHLPIKEFLEKNPYFIYTCFSSALEIIPNKLSFSKNLIKTPSLKAKTKEQKCLKVFFEICALSNLTLINKDGFSLLDLACLENHPAIMEVLINFKPSLMYRKFSKPKSLPKSHSLTFTKIPSKSLLTPFDLCWLTHPINLDACLCLLNYHVPCNPYLTTKLLNNNFRTASVICYLLETSDLHKKQECTSQSSHSYSAMNKNHQLIIALFNSTENHLMNVFYDNNTHIFTIKRTHASQTLVSLEKAYLMQAKHPERFSLVYQQYLKKVCKAIQTRKHINQHQHQLPECLTRIRNSLSELKKTSKTNIQVLPKQPSAKRMTAIKLSKTKSTRLKAEQESYISNLLALHKVGEQLIGLIYPTKYKQKSLTQRLHKGKLPLKAINSMMDKAQFYIDEYQRLQHYNDPYIRQLAQLDFSGPQGKLTAKDVLTTLENLHKSGVADPFDSFLKACSEQDNVEGFKFILENAHQKCRQAHTFIYMLAQFYLETAAQTYDELKSLRKKTSKATSLANELYTYRIEAMKYLFWAHNSANDPYLYGPAIIHFFDSWSGSQKFRIFDPSQIKKVASFTHQLEWLNTYNADDAKSIYAQNIVSGLKNKNTRTKKAI